MNVEHRTMNSPSSIPLAKRLFLAFGISWFGAVSLGLVYGARVIGTVSVAQLWVMAVIQVAVIISSIIAIFVTPLTAWVLQGCGVINRHFPYDLLPATIDGC